MKLSKQLADIKKKAIKNKPISVTMTQELAQELLVGQQVSNRSLDPVWTMAFAFAFLFGDYNRNRAVVIANLHTSPEGVFALYNTHLIAGFIMSGIPKKKMYLVFVNPNDFSFVQLL